MIEDLAQLLYRRDGQSRVRINAVGAQLLFNPRVDALDQR
jgi:hypothetical protein